MITLKKAIEILTMATGKGGIAIHDDYIHAQELGIDALIRLDGYRKGTFIKFEVPLPRETKE